LTPMSIDSIDDRKQFSEVTLKDLPVNDQPDDRTGLYYLKGLPNICNSTVESKEKFLSCDMNDIGLKCKRDLSFRNFVNSECVSQKVLAQVEKSVFSNGLCGPPVKTFPRNPDQSLYPSFSMIAKEQRVKKPTSLGSGSKFTLDDNTRNMSGELDVTSHLVFQEVQSDWSESSFSEPIVSP